MKPLQIWMFIIIMFSLTLGTNAFQLSKAYPTDFDLDFSGTGVVEEVSVKGSNCIIKLALFDWLNLSSNFPRTDIPSRNDRFSIKGNSDACNAITVATANTSNHIAFTIGQSGKNWYFVNPPLAGAGCGGLAINWKPEPELSN